MEEKDLSEDDKKILDFAPAVSQAVSEAIKEHLGDGFHFSLLLYNGKTGTLSGSEDMEKSLAELKKLIDYHESQKIVKTSELNKDQVKH